MSLIKSISGIRGTVGGKPGESLSPVDIVRFSAAYGMWLQQMHHRKDLKVVVGRDARESGIIVNDLLISTLRSMGINVIDLGLSATPTVEMAVTGTDSEGGVIITASHNPSGWNALKLLTDEGEFLSSKEGARLLEIAYAGDFDFVTEREAGVLEYDDRWGQRHIRKILDLELVATDMIKDAGLTVALDCINSAGGIILPQLLNNLGITDIIELNSVPDGNFAHNPEPLPENLQDLSDLVVAGKADLGFAVDPDVDRLAVICEDGTMFGEEYTLVAVADYVLENTRGTTVSNLSSTRALKDITEQHGCRYYASKVGEVNVVEEMKKRKAVIGGEGNGGVIYPELHYGRDALVGIALFLSSLVKKRMKCSALRKLYPEYSMVKKKMTFSGDNEYFSVIMEKVKDYFSDGQVDDRDGVWIGFESGWVQVRKSNTEPVIRIYAEGKNPEDANRLADTVVEIVEKF